MIRAMHPMLAFYKQTWWLWLIFLGVFAALSWYVNLLFVVMIPGLILYSIYFGVVRISELEEQNKNRHRTVPPVSAPRDPQE